MQRYLQWSPAEGALTQLYAGTMPEALNYNGEVGLKLYVSSISLQRTPQFMIAFARLGKCRSEAYDDTIGERLWNWLQEEVKPFRT